MLLSHRRMFVLVTALVLAVSATGCRAPEPEPFVLEADEDSRPGFALVSSAFEKGAEIPVRYAAEQAGGQNVSIPFAWENPPAGTKSFVIAIVDAHPSAQQWVHWLVADIPAGVDTLAEGASGSAMPDGARELINTYGDLGYGGPAPPPGSGKHNYVATIYALDVDTVELPEQPSNRDLAGAISSYVLGQASYRGTFER